MLRDALTGIGRHYMICSTVVVHACQRSCGSMCSVQWTCHMTHLSATRADGQPSSKSVHVQAGSTAEASFSDAAALTQKHDDNAHVRPQHAGISGDRSCCRHMKEAYRDEVGQESEGAGVDAVHDGSRVEAWDVPDQDCVGLHALLGCDVVLHPKIDGLLVEAPQQLHTSLQQVRP